MLFDYLCHIGNTLFGLYFHEYSSEWDSKLTYLLDNFDLLDSATISESECCIEICYRGNCYLIWVANHWYSYAWLYEVNGLEIKDHLRRRPSFRTMRRLHLIVSTLIATRRAAEQARINQFFQGINND
ncbi:hypothetical protein HI999_000764 [Salmonella enterica]|nr:hypothetical protein [Salmonella enterica]